MKIFPTPTNVGLADAVNARVTADARLIKARAALWVLGGVGLAAFGIGVGIAAALLAYARLNDKTFAAQQIADTLASALQNTKLTAAIDPASSIKLDPASTVALAPGGEVMAKGTVTVSGGSGDVPRPTQRQLNPAAAPETKARVTTDYTVFKSVDFGSGTVVTGYNFSPETDLPKTQYCYYAEGADAGDTSIRINLAKDGVFRAPKPRPGFDPQSAAGNCVWFHGGRTAF